MIESRSSGTRLRNVIIDTDAGSDDLMAIAFLLARKDVRIEAITIANGLAHVEAGAHNVGKLLKLAGRDDIPVFTGRPMPLKGSAAFPDEWRRISDDLPGVDLPLTPKVANQKTASEFLRERFQRRGKKVRVLALGPMTNLGEALQRTPEGTRSIEEVIIMGGAVDVPGNLGDGGYFQTENKTAEWNFYLDPWAARLVFDSGVKIKLVPLDATNKVPIDRAFLHSFQQAARTPLARFVGQVLETDRKYIEENFYYAWDPLAAVALIMPSVVETRACAIEIDQSPPTDGRTRRVLGKRGRVRTAVNADAAAFKRVFLRAFASSHR